MIEADTPIVLLYFCTSVLLYFCPAVLLYCCTAVPPLPPPAKSRPGDSGSISTAPLTQLGQSSSDAELSDYSYSEPDGTSDYSYSDGSASDYGGGVGGVG
jgi:hypothetical protein